SVGVGEHVALVGLDPIASEVFVNLLTGATLPESGDVRVFGRPTSAIADSDDWLATVDRFGIVSERAVLLDQLTILQNLAMPFTLSPGAVVRRLWQRRRTKRSRVPWRAGSSCGRRQPDA